MIKISPHRPLSILISLTLLLGAVLITQAAPPRSVGLLSFEATALANAVRLDWETATELETAGFIVKRSVNSGPFISLPDIGVPGFIDAAGNPAGFVIAIGGPAEGGIYQVMDADVQAGNDYTYKLIEVENDNNEIELEMQSVTFASAPTNTPTALPLVTTASDSTATATRLPDSTAPSIPTMIPAATATQAANNGTANAPAAASPTMPTVVPASQPATATERSQGGDQGAPNTTTNNNVLAQVETTATAVPPTPPETTTNGENGYPGIEAQSEPTAGPAAPTPVPLEPAVTAYPLATPSAGQDGATPVVPVIGSQSDTNEANLSQGTGGRDQQLGRIYLWSGFLLGFLIFITTVVATILLFTRKRTQ
jgi:hypothetical protein